MRVAVLQHSKGEWIGSMQSWFEQKAYIVTTYSLLDGDPLPSIDDFDWLISMGGPMGVDDRDEHAWIEPELQLLREAIADNKRVLGMCLGGQLMASAMGAEVYRNKRLEIGWFPIEKIHSSASWMPAEVNLLSWHGDCFPAPEGTTGFARSAVTPCQGFSKGNRIWALQFHLEAQSDTVDLFSSEVTDWKVSKTVQCIEQMKKMAGDYLPTSRNIMHRLLTVMDG